MHAVRETPEAQELWTRVDQYFERAFLAPDPALESTLRASRAAGLPDWQVSPLQGRLLQLLAGLVGAERILEIGTLGGYSTLWLARALPPTGRLLTLEIDSRHAALATENIARAGLEPQVEVRCGPALELLPQLAAEGRPPFDFTFIDADKPSGPQYFDWAVRLSRPGGLIVVDNVVRDGRVTDPDDADPNVRGTRALVECVGRDRRVSAGALTSVGVKGYDGFLIARVAPTPVVERRPPGARPVIPGSGRTP